MWNEIDFLPPIFTFRADYYYLNEHVAAIPGKQ